MNKIRSHYIFAALIASQTIAQNTNAKVEEVINPSSYVLAISIEKTSPIKTTNSTCSGFIIDENRKRIATSLHCIPEPERIHIPGSLQLKDGKIKEIGGEDKIIYPSIYVEGNIAEVICSDPMSDLVVLKTNTLPEGKLIPTITRDPIIGDTFSAVLSNKLRGGQLNTRRHLPENQFIEFPLHLEVEGKVLAISPGFLVDESTNKRTPIHTEMIFTNIELKGGFSGGPLVTSKGEAIGIVHGYDGAFGMGTSIKNLRQLLESEACK